jgi:transketolase
MAAQRLATEGIRAGIIGLYTIKPADAPTLRDAVLEALANGGDPLPVVRKLAVREMPGSATPAEYLAAAGLDAAATAAAARDVARI